MILMDPIALGLGPIIDVFIHFHWKFSDASPGHRYLVVVKSLLSFNAYMMQDGVISESLFKHAYLIHRPFVMPYGNKELG